MSVKLGNTSLLLRLMLLITLVLGVLGSQSTTSAHASSGMIRYVKPNGVATGTCDSWANACTLRYALGLAVSGDELWVAAGTYYPTTGISRSATFALISGVGVFGGFAGTETLRTERDPVNNVTILSGDIGVQDINTDNSFHVVTASGTNSSAILDGFTITRGNANGKSASANLNGGGIYNVGGSPTLSNLIIDDNRATNYGAGMYNRNGNPSLTYVTISNNSVKNLYGGGMYNDTSSGSLLYVTFSGNSAARAGGLYLTTNSNTTLNNVTFSNNMAVVRAGAMSVSGSNPILTNVTFDHNEAGSAVGGGVQFVYDSNATLTNVTFSGNSAGTHGGAVYIYQSSPTFTNITMSNNSANVDGGAIYSEHDSSPIVTNSIVYGNVGGQIQNVDNSSTTVTYSIVQGGYPGGTEIIDADPLLGPLQNNGGYTLTMAPGLGSPAIDSGDDATCAASDQRGVPRPQGAQCDRGAYEIDNATPLVTNVSSSMSDGSYNAGTVIDVSVTFSEPIIVTGAPQLTLETGSVDRDAAYVSGSGTASLTFQYTVQPGDTSADLDYVSANALTLTSGSIMDFAGIGANLTLPNPGEAGSLGDNKQLEIDTTAPNTMIDSAPADPSNTQSATFGFSSLDVDVVGFECQLDGGAWSACTNPKEFTGLSVTSHTFMVRAVDAAGNVDDTPASYTWGIDLGYPVVVSVTRAAGNPTGSAVVDFTVIFSENVIGVADSAPFEDFTLTSTGITGAAITGVSGSGTTYTVSVSTGSGNGTLRLDVVDNDTITNEDATDSLGGTGLGNGNFSSGEAYDLLRVFTSLGTQDGWILESGEATNVGGTMNRNATTLRVGDDARNSQYRTILSFDTTALPDGAVITSVTLKLKYAGIAGTNPFSTHGKLLADICKGVYKNNPALQLGDFKPLCSKNKVLLYTNTKVDNWYAQMLLPVDFQFINLNGVTQFRLRFTKDDNNDAGADFLKLYSGNATDPALHPQLIVEYHIAP